MLKDELLQSEELKALPEEGKKLFEELSELVVLDLLKPTDLIGLRTKTPDTFYISVQMPANKSSQLLEVPVITNFDANLEKSVRKYVNVFRSKISYYLGPEVGQKIDAVSFPDGIALDILHEKFIDNTDSFFGVPSIREAFNHLNQRPEKYYEGDELMAYNKAMDSNKRAYPKAEVYFGNSIFIVKAKNTQEWTVEKAEKDVNTIIEYFRKQNPNSLK